MSRQAVRLTNLSEDLIRMGHVPSNKILRIERTLAPPDVAYLLQVAPGEPVSHLERLRLPDGIPLRLLLPVGRLRQSADYGVQRGIHR